MVPKTLQVQRQKDVWVVTFLEVAFTPEVISELHTVLTQVESTAGPSAIVFASAAKAFSGGLNLKYIASAMRAGHRDAGRELLSLLMGVVARLLLIPVPTVAAIAGHCYAGGMAFACACDHRVMSDSGAAICMNEIDIDIAPPQGVISVVMAKTPPSISKDLFLTGRKMNAQGRSSCLSRLSFSSEVSLSFRTLLVIDSVLLASVPVMMETPWKRVTVTRVKDVWVVTLLEIAFTPDVVSELHSVLTLIESTPGPSAVVFASAAKAFSGGMNVKYITSETRAGHRNAGQTLIGLCMKLVARLLLLPVPTVAAIAGHCYAAGLCFACSCDHRVMSDSDAVICMNEIDMNIPVPEGVVSVVMAKTPPALSSKLFLTGSKVSAQEALAGGVVDAIVPKATVLQVAIDLGQSLAEVGTRRTAYRLIKLQLNGRISALCATPKFSAAESELLSRNFAKL